VNSAKVAYLKSINTNLTNFFAQLTIYIQTEIQTTFNSISADVVDCFNALEITNLYIKNPEIKLITGKDKAIELEIEFVSEKVTPAFKILSESQVNSFGLAIFLAAVKYFNSEFKFFILDDVVSSFDSFKRPRVSQLIATKFSDFQVLLLTHDQYFFDALQRDFPQWQRYKFTKWDYTTGTKCKPSKNYSEEIREYIDNDKPITAGQTLGRYLEWNFGVINENMQTKIRYKIENVHTLAEFYYPMVKRFKDKLKIPNKQHKLVLLFDDFETGTIFRNYCMHWKNESSPITSPEIEAVFKKWLEIEGMIYCTSCKSFVSYDASTGTEYIKCNCGAVDL
jgi:wobble nucleotide-excising tRNase